MMDGIGFSVSTPIQVRGLLPVPKLLVAESCIDLPCFRLLLSSAKMLRSMVLAGLLLAGFVSHGPMAQSPEKDGSRKDSGKGATVKGPIPYSTKSIARGKQFYLVHCVECHDQDGKGLGRRDFNGTPPADLTNPDEWTHGTSAEAVFSSVREGTKNDMPGYKDKLQDEQIWHVVNFVRSLWPEARRPKLETVTDPK